MKRSHWFCVLSSLLLLFGCPEREEPEREIKLVNNSSGPPARQDGSACFSDDACDGGLCLRESAGWPAGYCTTLDCTSGGCHGDDALCVKFLDGTAACFDGCETQDDCRSGYICGRVHADATRTCVPDDMDGPPPGRVGSACASDADCDEDLACDTESPGGYCFGPSCEACPEGSVCGTWNEREVCVDTCEDTIDCRPGYHCTSGICAPSEATRPEVAFDATREVLGITCEARELGSAEEGTAYAIDFVVPEDATSFTMVPFVAHGGLLPTRLEGPEIALDLREEYRHHNGRLTEVQFYDPNPVGTYHEIALDWPIMVPYAPQYADLVVPGATYSIEVTTDLEPPCFYLIVGRQGTKLDLNIHLVGLAELTAERAPEDPDLGQVLARVDELFASVGITLGDVRFFDAPPEIAQRYGIVRSFSDIKRLTAFGHPRDATLEGHLAIDVFLVEDIAIGSTGIVLGMSAGVPGPPGLHGNPGNGLVFRAVDLGYDNDYVAYIMAHELSHYLGLRHTTEMIHGTDTDQEQQFDAMVGTTDPIEDTPVCDNVVREAERCPDYTNLMFPTAPPSSAQGETVITEGQAEILRSNPLVTQAE